VRLVWFDELEWVEILISCLLSGWETRSYSKWVERRKGDLEESDLFGVCLPSRHIFCFFAMSFFFLLDTRSRRDISFCLFSYLVLMS
jgi:hypothetical protein